MSTAKIDPEAEMEAAFLRRLAKQLGVDELSEEALAKSLGFDSLTNEKLDEWFAATVGGHAREPNEPEHVALRPTRSTRRLAKRLGVDELSEEALAKSLGFNSLTDEKLDEWFAATVGGHVREPNEPEHVALRPTRSTRQQQG